MELQASTAQSLSVSDIKNSMAIPLSYVAGNSISGWHIFADARDQSESRNPISTFSNLITKRKIRAALELFDFIYFPSLVQFWSPIISQHHHHFLDSSDLPFALSRLREGVSSFRKHCSNHRYNLHGNRCGPPGRVFQRRFPEFCPDIRCYSEEEFELKEMAMAAGFRGYLCLPVYEPDWHSCIGVLEIFTMMDGSYCFGDVIEKVSASLKEVGLRCCDVFRPFDPNRLTYNQLENGPAQYKLAVNEIQNVLDVLCRKYKLPFAQTWVATLGGSSDESFISTAKKGPHASVRRVSSFERDCNWFHLRKGQGIVWKAFLSGACFCRDLTKLSVVDYSLVLGARKVDFTSGFAICLQSTYTRNLVGYIIELFLPPNQTLHRKPWIFLTSLVDEMKQLFQTFKLRTGQEIGSEILVAVLQACEGDSLDPFVICKTMHAGEGVKYIANIAQRAPPEPLIFYTGASGSGRESDEIKETTAGSSNVSQNGKMVLLHDTTTDNRSNELHPQQTAVSTEALEKLSGNKLTNFPDNPNVKRSVSSSMNPAPEAAMKMMVKALYEDVLIKFELSLSAGMSELKHEIIKRLKLDDGCFEVKYTDEYNCPVLVNTDAALQNCITTVKSLQKTVMRLSIHPIRPQIMTVKASYGDDIIKFKLPLSSGMMKLKEEVTKRLKLEAGSYVVMYLDDDSNGVLLDGDAALTEYMATMASMGIYSAKISLQPI